MLNKSGVMLPRKNLLRLLADLSEEQIIYICAPAGYGKTVSIRQWLEQDGNKNALISLDEFDNSPAHFCRGFCAALQNCQPENVYLSQIYTHPAFDTAPEEFAVRAIASLSGGESVRLAVDDLHFVHDERSLRLLLTFLKRLPGNFQIALISRSELPPGFSDLLLKGNLARVTADDLRFSREEIMLLYEKRGYHIMQDKADEIRRFTNGWAIGIGVLLLSGGDPQGESLKYLDEFIYENVWKHWNKDIRDFMVKTAAVWELTPSLCVALTGLSSSKAMLDHLVQHNVFISRTEQGVYQYHQMFHDFLHKLPELKENEFSLLEKAGYWYLEQNDFYNAIECFIRCKSHKGIIKCFIFLAVIDRNNFIVDKLLPIFQSPIIFTAAENFAFIYSMLAWVAFVEGRASDMAEYMDRYYKKQFTVLRYDPHLAFYIIFARLIDFRVTIHELMQLIKKIPKPLLSVKAIKAKPSIGIINQYMPLLHRGTRDFSECAIGDTEANVGELLKAIGALFGAEAILLSECMAAGILYEQGYLEKAYGHALASNAEIRKQFATETKLCAMSILACILDALDQQEQAGQAIKRISDMIEEDGAFFLNYNFKALSTRHKLAKGDVKAAKDWLNEYEPSLYKNIDFYKLYGHLTTCRAYITIGDYDSAIIILKKTLILVESYSRPLDTIETLILMAISFWKKKRGFQDEALQHLEQAVSVAYSYGYTQLFVNDSAELSGMLNRLKRRMEQRGDSNNVPVSFIKMLYLKTLEHQKDGLTSGQASVPIKFTEKQKMVIKLLCNGKSYKEIAETLGIKLSTLRSHIELIYTKLDVTSLTEAVVRIRKLGILGDE